jgi:hypothetical protein
MVAFFVFHPNEKRYILGNMQTTITNFNEHHLNLLTLLGKRYEAFYY